MRRQPSIARNSIARWPKTSSHRARRSASRRNSSSRRRGSVSASRLGPGAATGPTWSRNAHCALSFSSHSLADCQQVVRGLGDQASLGAILRRLVRAKVLLAHCLEPLPRGHGHAAGLSGELHRLIEGRSPVRRNERPEAHPFFLPLGLDTAGLLHLGLERAPRSSRASRAIFCAVLAAIPSLPGCSRRYPRSRGGSRGRPCRARRGPHRWRRPKRFRSLAQGALRRPSR